MQITNFILFILLFFTIYATLLLEEEATLESEERINIPESYLVFVYMNC